jgi:hypothetical protein
MQDDGIEQQRQRLAENQTHIDEMKTRLRFEEIEPFGGRWATPITPERLQKRRYWIVIALTIYNGFALFQGLREVVYWPSSAKIWLSREQVKVYHDTDGTERYRATVPLKEFPYDLELQQSHRFDLLSTGAVNLILLVPMVYSYRQESRLRRKPDQHGTPAEPPAADG